MQELRTLDSTCVLARQLSTCTDMLEVLLEIQEGAYLSTSYYMHTQYLTCDMYISVRHKTLKCISQSSSCRQLLANKVTIQDFNQIVSAILPVSRRLASLRHEAAFSARQRVNALFVASHGVVVRLGLAIECRLGTRSRVSS